MDFTRPFSPPSPLLPSQIPAGFQFAAVKAGLKRSGKTDFSCIVCDHPASAAAMFTANRIQAAPLTIDKLHLEETAGQVRVVVINAGNANCVTGQAGLLAARQVCAAAAEVFGCHANEVFPSSTGIIGVPLPAEKLIKALPEIKTGLGRSPQHLAQVAQAILTTDTREKIAHRTVEIDGHSVQIVAVAKGAGMIHPQLLGVGRTRPQLAMHATMLVYILTDAAIEPGILNQLLRDSADISFNRISVDGDTSTNDTVLLLASGASDATVTQWNSHSFAVALTEVCTSLAKQVVADGEGITHVVQLDIEGAATDADALQIAKSIAHSPLVKTAWAGNDPNWGRILAAIGYSGVEIDPATIALWFGDQEICTQGGRSPHLDESAAHEYLKQPEITVRVDLGMGEGKCRFWTTDLTTEYVHINADYSS